jgi:phosphoribosyl-ATP pyrophosphohydrolase
MAKSADAGKPGAADVIERLFAVIESRQGADPDVSYTAKLFNRGTEKIAQKLGEEAVELAIAAVKRDRQDTVAESADLLYHWLVLLADAGISPAEVCEVLESREGTSGLEEKASRKTI